MNAHEYARHLCEKADKLGLEAPTVGMIAEAIHNAECNTRDYCIAVLRANKMHAAAKEIEDNYKRKMMEDT